MTFGKKLVALLVVVLVLVAAAVEAGNTINMNKKSKKRVHSLPLHKRQVANKLQQTKNRATTKIHDVPLNGNITDIGLYYVEILVGTPAQTFIVDVDTGSSDTLIPLASCSGCSGHLHSYDPDSSKTAKKVSCDDYELSCQSCQHDGCSFEDDYGQGTSVIGVMYKDAFQFAAATDLDPVDVYIGGIDKETGTSFMPDGVDGIMGMAYDSISSVGAPSPFDILVSEGEIDNVFSICMGDEGGVLTLGGYDKNTFSGELQYTPIVQQEWYVVNMNSMAIGGARVPVSSWNSGQSGTIVDSGTTLAVCSTKNYEAIVSTFQKHYASLPGISGSDSIFNCNPGVNGTYLTSEQLSSLPAMTINLDGVSLQLSASDYLVEAYPAQGQYCFGFVAMDGLGTILGDLVMQAFTVVFDRENSQIGFAPVADCS